MLAPRLAAGGRLALGSILLAALACSGSSSSGTPDPAAKREPAAEPAAEPASKAPLSDEVRAKVCAALHVDESSQIFLARNKAGVAERIVVTPSRTIADMGNLVFDMNGQLLGHDTGSEFPWDDQARAGEERARLAKLMSGSMVGNTEAPLSCK
jgi:cytochrome c5